MTTLTIIGRPGCHLCGAADDIVDAVLADLPDEAPEVVVEHASILDDEALYEAWWDKIPVVLLDGHLHAHWRLSADRLREALLAADSDDPARPRASR